VKGLLRLDEVVGRHHGHRGVRIVAEDPHRGQADARRRVAPARLGEDRLAGQLGKLCGDQVRQRRRGGDQHAVGSNQVAEPVDGGAEHGLRAGQAQQLLGPLRAALRPESRAGSPGHDDGVEHGSG
jgi:hypothetical protein